MPALQPETKPFSKSFEALRWKRKGTTALLTCSMNH
jgi:hypothetical protein